MKKVFLVILAVLLLGPGMTGCSSAPQATPEMTAVRIGIYDSRSIAIAFAGTEFFNQKMSALQKEYSKAKSAGDQKRIAELEAEGAAQQELLHKQGFSTAPVDDMLIYIEDKLPAIQQEAGVSLILSKWDQEALAKYPSAELVDITMLLVDALQPNERQRNYAIDIQQREPVPLEDAKKIED